MRRIPTPHPALMLVPLLFGLLDLIGHAPPSRAEPPSSPATAASPPSQTASTLASGPADGSASEARSNAATRAVPIEEAGKRFLDQYPAPEEIRLDWNDWAQRSGGEIWERPGLSRAQRSIVTISILSVLREEEPLRVHIEAGIANGLTRLEISEIIMHSAVYAGVPQALRSMRIAREVFDRLDATAASD